MPTARTTRTADLEPLLDLFRASEVSSVVGTIEQAHAIWRQTLDRDGVTVFVSESDGKIVATCMLIAAPNLLRSGRGHAFLENVVTILNSEDEGMVGLWSRPRFLTPGRQVAITSCCKAAGSILEYTASTSAAVSSQDCALPMSLAASKSTNDRPWHGRS